MSVPDGRMRHQYQSGRVVAMPSGVVARQKAAQARPGHHHPHLPSGVVARQKAAQARPGHHHPHLPHHPHVSLLSNEIDGLGNHVFEQPEPVPPRERSPRGRGSACPYGHSMYHTEEDSGWTCDMCRRKPEDSSRLRCKKCDYDVCKDCQLSLPMLSPPRSSPGLPYSPLLALSPLPDAALTEMSPSTLTASYERAPHISPADVSRRISGHDRPSGDTPHAQQAPERTLGAQARELQSEVARLQQEKALLERRVVEMTERGECWCSHPRFHSTPPGHSTVGDRLR